MEKKELVVIEKETLLNLISRAHKWCAVANCSDIWDNYTDDEFDAMLLEYAESTGLAFPEGTTGFDAIEDLSKWDLDFYYEVETYGKREIE